MASTKPTHYKYNQLVSDIEKGQIKIPQFQREFVWDRKRSAKLLDSILKNYPIGTFIFWRTKEELRSIRDIGNIQLPPSKTGEFVTYVLDGQQRITSLFASLKGEKIKREGKHETDYSKIYIDLNANEDEAIVITDERDLSKKTYISIKDLIAKDLPLLVSTYSREMLDKIEKYYTILTGYDFSVVEVQDAEIDIATDIFTRINIGNKPLKLFEIMVAKTYNSERKL